jgi:hypothetical protein
MMAFDDDKDDYKDDYKLDEVLWHRLMGSGIIERYPENVVKGILPEG